MAENPNETSGGFDEALPTVDETPATTEALPGSSGPEEKEVGDFAVDDASAGSTDTIPTVDETPSPSPDLPGSSGPLVEDEAPYGAGDEGSGETTGPVDPSVATTVGSDEAKDSEGDASAGYDGVEPTVAETPVEEGDVYQEGSADKTTEVVLKDSTDYSRTASLPTVATTPNPSEFGTGGTSKGSTI